MKEKVYLIGISLFLTAFWGCQEQDMTESNNGSVTVDLAFSVSHAARETRLTDEVVQEVGSNPRYRGLDVVAMIPFAISGDEVISTDRPLRLFGEARQIDESEKTTGTYGAFYLFKSYSMMRGTNAFLVYGKGAPLDASFTSDVERKHYYGSLVAPESTDLINPELNTLSFCPDPIHDDIAAPVEAQLLAGYLTSIANATTAGGITWSNTTDPTLKPLFMNFIGLRNDGNMLMAGSSDNIIAYVNAWYEDISDLQEGNLTAEGKALKNAILARIQVNSYTITIGEGEKQKTYTMNLTFSGNTLESVGFDYPASMGLPDGAAVLRWAKNTTTEEYEFIPQTQTTPMDNINSINRYCYPAELYYYTNSCIDTSNETVDIDSYNKENWDGDGGVLTLYENKKWFVTGNTQSVAIQKPLQYAVGRLKMSMRAKHTEYDGFLQDAVGDWVSLININDASKNSFPLTGMIVGNQHPVGFDFKPILDQNNQESHVEDSFIYDSQMKNGESDYYLTTDKKNVPSTLVLQSYDGEEVIIMLEFRNDSGRKFYGVNGVIYPGTKFYLTGKIKPEDAEVSAIVPDDVKQRVFTQDYVTTVGTIVESLENAYSVMPDILGGRLEIGVQLTTDWIQATTTNVVLE